MSTVWIHPEAPKYQREHLQLAVQNVAWIQVMIIAHVWAYNATDRRVGLVQSFIDANKWKGRAMNNCRGDITRNRVRNSNYSSRQLRPGANGLMENSGGGVVIIWEWEQVLEWLSVGWPTKNVTNDMSSPIGTWCFKDGVDPSADHIDRNPYCGWPNAMKQMRSIGIPPEVRRLERPITEHEIIDGLCGALKKHRVTLNKLYE